MKSPFNDINLEEEKDEEYKCIDINKLEEDKEELLYIVGFVYGFYISNVKIHNDKYVNNKIPQETIIDFENSMEKVKKCICEYYERLKSERD